jgi:hypothetical protein
MLEKEGALAVLSKLKAKEERKAFGNHTRIKLPVKSFSQEEEETLDFHWDMSNVL